LSSALVFWRGLLAIALVGISSSTVFLGMVLVAFGRHRAAAKREKIAGAQLDRSELPAVTIFKPLHGMEPNLGENLSSFFRQNYPAFEIIFGAREQGDAALSVVEDLRKKFPQVTSRIVVSGPPTWPNAKVYSLAKMIPLARHEYFVISDSDVRVGPDFLANLIPSLLRSEVGLLTCLYRGIPAGDFPSTLEALGMSVEMPSGVVVAEMLEGIRFALGPAVALRRESLESIGGVAVTADYYSDDYELGNRIWAAGYRVIFSHEIVEHVLTPRSLARTLGDQLRWMKSTRYSRPRGHIGSGLTYAMPFGILGLVAASALGHPYWGLALMGLSLLNRLIQSVVIGWGLVRDPRAVYLCWLYPLRDLLGFFIWVASFTGRNFYWRGEHYRFGNRGRITPRDRPAESTSPDAI
jgi:ceramide glucosyltransferase